jgi:hypothetical protein
MLPFRSGRARRVIILILVTANLAAFSTSAQQKKKIGRKKARAATSASPSPGSQVPLPIGHEAKGLVFPDMDENGHLRGRFVAGTARRVDQDHMEFRDLNITTFTEDDEVDLEIAMPHSVLDMNTRILTSTQPTTIKRTDFQIVGDTGRFDTAKRQGTITGNVKMRITNAAKYSGQKPR